MRLDNYLVSSGMVESRTKAQTIIKASLVTVNDVIIKKPSYSLDDNQRVIIQEHKSFVSRSGHKLDDFLDEIALDDLGDNGLDIGSSTGGFTQVLLQRGVKQVTAVDVGTAQLHKTLLDDERVISVESCDIREFESDTTYDIVVSDVAFISLLYILDDIQRLSSNKIILLFKPQFEVGRDVKRDSKGVVKDEKAIENAMKKFEDACMLKGWTLVVKTPSRLIGKEGNLEYCYYFSR